MFALRGTEKLRKTLGLPLAASAGAPPTSTTVLGDWYANLICVRPRIVLCISAETFLPIAMTGDELRDHLVPRLRTGVEQTLRGMGISEAHIQAELASMADCHVGKAISRKVVGVLNNFAYHLLDDLHRGHSPGSALGRLGDMPCAPLGYGTPLEATRRRFAELLQN